MALKFDISNTNFDNYFSVQGAGLGESQKDLLPKELIYKLFRKGGKPNTKSTSKLTFLAKIFILIKALKKRVIILVEDDINGMDEEQYFKYKKLLEKNSLSIDNARGLVSDGIFVLANKEIIDTYTSINLLSASKAYNFITKAKNMADNKTELWSKEMAYLCKFLSFYESNRKRISTQTGLTFADWLILIHIYNGEEYEGAPIYKEWYRYSCNSSQNKMKVALSTLQERGYVSKSGATFKAKYSITAYGRSKVAQVLNKYAINC